MKYCITCVTPDTRPHIKFHEDGECSACKNFKKQKTTDWDARWKELEKLADKYRGCNGNGYDCAIAVSGGKDSTFIVEMVSKLNLNPVLLSVSNIDWTATGRHNLNNLSDTYSKDIIILQPNINVTRILSKQAFIEQGKPTTYWDTIAYAYVFKMAAKLNTKLIFWGENVSYTYGGIDDEETPSGKKMAANKVATPEFDKWIKDGLVTEKEVDSARMMTAEECDAIGLEPVYMQYYTGWDSYRNYLIARRNGFRHLGHEHIREGAMESWNQIDTLSYLINDWMRYPKFGHGAATQIGSRLIRAGYATREEIIKEVKKYDKVLDQDVAKGFMDFIGMKPKEFWAIIDKWYNPDLFYQDKDGLWHEKFEVGVGLK